MHIFKLLAMVNPGDYPQPVSFGGVGHRSIRTILRPLPVTMIVTEVG
jgi:hypothetical protein